MWLSFVGLSNLTDYIAVLFVQVESDYEEIDFFIRDVIDYEEIDFKIKIGLDSLH